MKVLTRRPAEADPLGQSLEQHSEQYIKYLKKNKKFEGFFFEIQRSSYWQTDNRVYKEYIGKQIVSFVV